VEVPLPDPGHRPVAQMTHPAVETGGGSQSGDDIPIRGVVEDGIEGIVIIWYQVGQFLGGCQVT